MMPSPGAGARYFEGSQQSIAPTATTSAKLLAATTGGGTKTAHQPRKTSSSTATSVKVLLEEAVFPADVDPTSVILNVQHVQEQQGPEDSSFVLQQLLRPRPLSAGILGKTLTLDAAVGSRLIFVFDGHRHNGSDSIPVEQFRTVCTVVVDAKQESAALEPDMLPVGTAVLAEFGDSGYFYKAEVLSLVKSPQLFDLGDKYKIRWLRRDYNNLHEHDDELFLCNFLGDGKRHDSADEFTNTGGIPRWKLRKLEEGVVPSTRGGSRGRTSGVFNAPTGYMKVNLVPVGGGGNGGGVAGGGFNFTSTGGLGEIGERSTSGTTNTTANSSSQSTTTSTTGLSTSGTSAASTRVLGEGSLQQHQIDADDPCSGSNSTVESSWSSPYFQPSSGSDLEHSGREATTTSKTRRGRGFAEGDALAYHSAHEGGETSSNYGNGAKVGSGSASFSLTSTASTAGTGVIQRDRPRSSASGPITTTNTSSVISPTAGGLAFVDAKSELYAASAAGAEAADVGLEYKTSSSTGLRTNKGIGVSSGQLKKPMSAGASGESPPPVSLKINRSLKNEMSNGGANSMSISSTTSHSHLVDNYVHVIVEQEYLPEEDGVNEPGGKMSSGTSEVGGGRFLPTTAPATQPGVSNFVYDISATTSANDYHTFDVPLRSLELQGLALLRSGEEASVASLRSALRDTLRALISERESSLVMQIQAHTRCGELQGALDKALAANGDAADQLKRFEDRLKAAEALWWPAAPPAVARAAVPLPEGGDRPGTAGSYLFYSSSGATSSSYLAGPLTSRGDSMQTSSLSAPASKDTSSSTHYITYPSSSSSATLGGGSNHTTGFLPPHSHNFQQHFQHSAHNSASASEEENNSGGPFGSFARWLSGTSNGVHTGFGTTRPGGTNMTSCTVPVLDRGDEMRMHLGSARGLYAPRGGRVDSSGGGGGLQHQYTVNQ
ncbi:unnamed protein product [Amoebophrya sp. A25]|nr:unnamed protein product [Amoebophrya sp. A25]|eukprot:GSA25T00008448001.1